MLVSVSPLGAIHFPGNFNVLCVFCFRCWFLSFLFSGLSDITAPKGVIESNEQNFRLLENVEQRQHETSSFRKGQSVAVADGGSNSGNKGEGRGRRGEKCGASWRRLNAVGCEV